MWLISTADEDGTRIKVHDIAFNCMGQAQGTLAEQMLRARLGMWAGHVAHPHADRQIVANTPQDKPSNGHDNCHLQEEMQREAQAIVAERRGPEISALTTESSREGVFAWAGGQPRAGQCALLAYNKACGALRCCLQSQLKPLIQFITYPVMIYCVRHSAGKGHFWLGPDATERLQEVEHCIAGMPGMWWCTSAMMLGWRRKRKMFPCGQSLRKRCVKVKHPITVDAQVVRGRTSWKSQPGTVSIGLCRCAILWRGVHGRAGCDMEHGQLTK